MQSPSRLSSGAAASPSVMRSGQSAVDEHSVTVLIIGAGFSGICAAVRLTQELPEATFVVIEKEADIGGTWHAAAGYPGAAVDVPSPVYSFSFARNPHWSHKFSPSKEIKSYIKDVASKHGVTADKGNVRVSSAVTNATWEEASATWRVSVRHMVTGQESLFHARFLVSGVGALYVPAFPEIPGLNTFVGPKLHSARWDSKVNLEGKRVAVIGSGASAIQLVPALAKEVPGIDITVFQRTPAWIVPRRDYAYPSIVKWLFALLPGLLWLYRFLLWAAMDFAYYVFIEDRPFDSLEFTLPLVGTRINVGACLPRWLTLRPVAQWLARRHMNKTLPPGKSAAIDRLREQLTPNYQMGCKRVILSDDWYPSFLLPHVHLETSGIKEIVPSGIRTKDGRLIECDVLICATGFDVLSTVTSVDVKGQGGADLRQQFLSRGAETEHGITVPGFPNFFICLGPSTGLGHNSIIFMIECQINYFLACVKHMRAKGFRSMVVKPEAVERFVKWLARRMVHTTWQSGCASWYLQGSEVTAKTSAGGTSSGPSGGPKGGPKGGRNLTMWPGTVTQYWFETRKPNWDDFIFASSGSSPSAALGKKLE